MPTTRGLSPRDTERSSVHVAHRDETGPELGHRRYVGVVDDHADNPAALHEYNPQWAAKSAVNLQRIRAAIGNLPGAREGF